MDLVIFLLLLSVLVLVHELGHFVVARFFGVGIEEFGLGMPPRAKKLFRWKETLFSLNWLPIGGFVKLVGEDRSEKVVKTFQGIQSKIFWKQKPGKKLLILLAGVVMNFCLALVLFGMVYTVNGVPVKVDEGVVLAEVMEGSPAWLAGLRSGELIVGWESIESFIQWIDEHQGEEIELELEDGRKVKIVPRIEDETPEGEGALGVVISEYRINGGKWYERLFLGMKTGIEEGFLWGGEIVKGFGGMIAKLVQGESIGEDVAGPVGIYQATRDVKRMGGFWALIHFTGVLSVNFAVLNLLPIPALDGGRIVLVIWELVIGRPINQKWEQRIHWAGYMALMGLLLLITIKDVIKIWF